ncbi:MAG: glycosyltransferase family 4 protein [Candidatus Aminicenantes bacterium]|nr:glycosyltransferase family 4 protein [Candidatus Aminicenantes bacterium]
MRVDQLVPAFHRGDAIGDEAVELRGFFRRTGAESEIYCLTRDRGLEGEARLFAEFPAPAADDVTILHFALPSPLTEGLARLPSLKAVIYHNITPAEFFEGTSPEMARIARLGREELASLQPHVELGLADSEYNRLELEALGFRNTHVFPLFVDFARYERPANAFVENLFRDGRTNILFVGRVAPNKRVENLVKTLFYYKKYISPLVRLIVVGKTATFPSYFEAVSRMADEFYLQPEEVRFVGHIPDDEMYALYRAADVFLSLSEHEGYCLPLVEAMMFDLPVVALGAAAVPYTLGEAGVVLKDSRPAAVAELVDIVARDAALRAKLVAAGRRELAKVRSFPREAFLRSRLGELRRSR